MKIFVAGPITDNAKEVFFKVAEELGNLLAQDKGNHLIFGGVSTGPLGQVYKIMERAGNPITAVVPEVYAGDLGHIRSNHSFVTKTNMQRTEKLIELAEVIIILPGGRGTQSEFYQVVESKRAGEHKKPIVLLNLDNCYKGILLQDEEDIKNGFSKPSQQGYFFVAETVSSAMDYIKRKLQ